MSTSKIADKVCKGICKISRGDKLTIVCYKCEMVVHEKCSGLSKQQLETYNPNDQSGLVYLCRMCLITCKKDYKFAEQNEQKLNELTEMRQSTKYY